MSIYDHKGRLKIPEPSAHIETRGREAVLSVCCCPNGHSLISSRARFNKLNGILLKVIRGEEEGYLALSPVINDKSRIMIDIEPVSGAAYDLICPVCRESLPQYAPCPCGGKIVFMLAGNEGEYIGICNVADCPNAVMIPHEDLLRSSGLAL